MVHKKYICFLIYLFDKNGLLNRITF